MPAIRETSRQISSRLDKLEKSLKKKLLAFYDSNIAGSFEDVAILRRRYDTRLRNTIRKAVQDSYLEGTDIVGTQITEKNPDFQLFISGTDINNIQAFTNDMVNQFWDTSRRLLARESEFQDGEKKPDLNIPAVMTGLAALITFKAFNAAVKSKVPQTITQTQTITQPSTLTLDIGFEVKRLENFRGRIMFMTQRDAKVDPIICQPFDGQVYEHDDPDIPEPPLHRFCRCHLVPLIDTLETA